ncbi:hypothetical protein PSQ19_13770 [Devosia algicola]|uniref:LPS-assembly lipoprotein n=1 Tax=Devosia algicola TaxID=3026418 RepID=A0ABY7YKK5_9HYPH|nr:LPS assembly lipoprotein LptE [Devosia algicola]WDR01786.1 hypothetical protein PSQ19_13770 [Devosia algicola]
MLSFNPLVRAVLMAAALLATSAIGACTFAPVYSGTLAQTPHIPMAYAKPQNRLAQIVNQELALRLGTSSTATAPLAQVVATSAVRALTRSQTVNPNRAYEISVTATLTITARDGTDAKPLSFTRTATAQFSSSGQVLAATEANIEAGERAARAVAESLRMAVLAQLSRR